MANSDQVRTSAASAGANELRIIWECNGNERTSNLVRAGSCPMVCLALAKEMNAPHQNFIATALRPPPTPFLPLKSIAPMKLDTLLWRATAG